MRTADRSASSRRKPSASMIRPDAAGWVATASVFSTLTNRAGAIRPACPRKGGGVEFLDMLPAWRSAAAWLAGAILGRLQPAGFYAHSLSAYVAPVALQQSRILRKMHNLSTSTRSIPAASKQILKNQVLLRLRCLVLFRPRTTICLDTCYLSLFHPIKHLFCCWPFQPIKRIHDFSNGPIPYFVQSSRMVSEYYRYSGIVFNRS